MAEVTVRLRNGTAVHTEFGAEPWELKDSERLVLLLDSAKRVRYACNLADFVDLMVVEGDGE